MLKLNYFLADIFILSAEKQPIKLSWRKIEWLHIYEEEISNTVFILVCGLFFMYGQKDIGGIPSS